MAGPTRWGIVSTGTIAFDFVNALTLLPAEDHKIAAVAARTLENAEKFAKQFNITKTYGSYKELADDAEIDIIYIGTITSTHFDVCKLFIEAGKNVLCEKPLTMKADQAKAILDIAREKGVFFMEGLWSRCFPAYQKLREALAAQTIGDIKLVRVAFGADFLDKWRIGTKEMGDGATYGLGSYPIQLSNLVFGEAPTKVLSSGFLTAAGVDEAIFTTLHYSNNRVAQFTCHAKLFLSNKAEIYGSKGMIEIPNFWAPDSITIAGGKYDFPMQKPKLPMKLPQSEGFVYEAQSVRECLLKGQKENPLITMDESMAIMTSITDILTQVGYY